MNNIYIKTQSNNLYTDTPCVLCGEIFEPGDNINSLHQDDNNLGYVCLHCIEDVENGTMNRIDRHIQKLNEHITWLHDIKKQL